MALLGSEVPSEYDAISFLLPLLLIALLPRAAGTPPRGAGSEGSPRGSRSLLRDLQEGARCLREDRLLLRLALLGSLASLFAMGLQGLYAPYIQRDLGGGTAPYGLCNSCFALGSIGGGLAVGHWARRIRAGRLIPLGLVGQGIGIFALGLLHLWWLALLVALGIGASQETNLVPWRAFLRSRIPIPRGAFGRVSTLLGALWIAPSPVAVVGTSFVAGTLIIGTIYSLYGLATLVCIAVAFSSARDL